MAEALTLNPMSFRPNPSPPLKQRDRSGSRDSNSSSERLARPQQTFRSISGSWGVSGVGRGFDWRWDHDREDDANVVEDDEQSSSASKSPVSETAVLGVKDIDISPPSTSPRSLPPIETSHLPDQEPSIRTADTITPGSITATPTSPGIRPSRRAPSRRISLISGRHMPPPSDLNPEELPPVSPRISLSRTNSTASLALSVMMPLSRRNSDAEYLMNDQDPRTPLEKQEITYSPIYTPFNNKSPVLTRNASVSSTFSARSASAPSVASEYDDDSYDDEAALAGFGIEADAGRGAYGLVKRARRVDANGLPFGPPLIIKYVIKSRILADSWKRHRQYGTIPIEIYVLLFLTNVPNLLIPRPWHPSRKEFPPDLTREPVQQRGHDNIGKLLEFWEDAHYYYLVMPFEEPGTDLFDLVEANPAGLSPYDVRSLFGQIADGVEFLHSKGIIHRDLKDENVVLGPNGTCYLIDFGSCASGWREGKYWDTFSGTLDYAGPEILRGERYTGKPQDVYALGVIGYVLLVGECPYATATEAQAGLAPGSKAAAALEARCGPGFEEGHRDVEAGREGEENDGGGTLEDAGDLVRRCLSIDVDDRPQASRILEHRFLAGRKGWVGKEKVL
ncbi:kinase-like protein [Dacryopinax primogenitus]|uniref:Kinase-like protein n=1 Tax=Dacryopinax primogenitus (strain DJM 731) TaxID=1858805 RepID=M5FZ09_DACPD|nr:kinase-like protein [Dacryopinax primogenitus]EJU01739.1 kinase-like protein [Dacryopinax primogenitus]